MNASAWIRLLAWCVALGLLALPVVGLLNGSFASDRWPLRNLDLVAEHRHVEPEAVRDAVARHAGRGFFALSLVELRRDLAALPWVEAVEVRKRWPDTVVVRLLEYQPYAVWNDDALVSRGGQMFEVPGIEDIAGLPRLHGPQERVAEVANFNARAQAILSGTGLALSHTRLSERGSWSIELAGGTVLLLGRDQAEQRLARFAATAPGLLRAQPERPLVRADLRYPNGYALAWGEPRPAAGDGAAIPPAGAAAPAREQGDNA
ncbi:MAG: cell division protein FtsQ/DivIB [Xanthomonadales bacterium]|nr:cell division protein FtsQ/DivIB [Xanthomonadales bacterium]